MFRRRLVVETQAVLQQDVGIHLPGILHVGHMMERFLDVGNLHGGHLLLVTLVIVFQLVARSEGVVVYTAVVDPLLAREGV